LQIPESVQVATAALFANNDFLSDFLKEMCVMDRDEKEPVKAMWDAYERWRQGQGEEPAQGRTFNHMMEERGFVRKQARVYGVSGKAGTGIRLKQHDELMKELAEDDQRNPEVSQSDRPHIKQVAEQGTYRLLFNGNA
jgi:hypothetical protein